MANATDFITKGAAHAERAIHLDRQACRSNDPQHFDDAKRAYMAAVDHFFAALPHEKNLRIKASLRARMATYIDRAEIMKAWLEQYHQAAATAAAAAAAAATASPADQPTPRPHDLHPAPNHELPPQRHADQDRNPTADDVSAPSREDTPPDQENENGPSAGGGSGGGGGGGSGGGTKKKKKKKKDEPSESDKLQKQLGTSILAEKPNVKWSDVAGLEAAKDALKEAVIYPARFPQMFVGKRKPWKGILLYGPPGTGKSYLAKAVATEADAQFFSVSSSDLVSKWQGESEKLVKELFAMARAAGKAIIFIDEIDALVSSRSDSESESSRRIKTEFLVQMDGVGKTSDGVLLLGATNIPWGLDDALLRRMERRVYIPLPESRARAKMFLLNLGSTPHSLDQEDFADLAERAEGYSGSDIAILVRDAIMQPVRTLQNATFFKRINVQDEGRSVHKFAPCSPGDPEGVQMNLMNVKPEELYVPVVSRYDFELALEKTKPSVGKENIEKHVKFTTEKGQSGV